MSRLLALALVVGLAVPALAGTGDVNGDSKVTAADAVLAMKVAGGLLKPTPAQQFAADVVPAAPDGLVTINDAARIARIALGVDPAMPVGLMKVITTLIVSGNGARNITLAGGYPVSGKLTDAAGTVFTGSIAFANTSTSAVGDSALLDVSTGAFSQILAAGTYQPVAVTTTTRITANGETESVDRATPVGSPITVAGPVTGLALKRPALSTPSVVTFSFSGPSTPYLTTAHVTLTDTGSTPATYGLNYVLRDVSVTPAATNVPVGTYNVAVHSQAPLSNSLYEDLTVWYHQALSVSGSLSRTLVFPRLYELGGTINGPPANPAFDFYAELQPVGTADASAGYVQVDQYGGYLAAIQPGFHHITIGVTSPQPSTLANFVLPYTMPASNATKSIAIPAMQSFRTITGKVITPSGGAAGGVHINASLNLSTVPIGGAYVYDASVVTDATGAYTLKLPDGTYTLKATP